MGGSIAVTIRTPDGEIHKMARCTNTLPSFVMNPRFLASDREWVEKYLAYWHALCKDWRDNQSTGNFRRRDTPYYAPHQICAPLEYGLVFLDMQEKVIHDCQGYTTFDAVYAYHFSESPEEAAIYQQFAREGKLTVQRYNRRLHDWEDTGKVFDGNLPQPAARAYWRSLWKTMPYRNLSENVALVYRTLCEQVANVWYRRQDDAYFKLKLDLSPYTLIDWEEVDGDRVSQFEQMRDAIAQVIPLTPDDLAGWDTWLQQLRQDALDDAEIEGAAMALEEAEDDHTSH